MRAAALAACAALLACLGCDRPPSDDEIREWTAADHDRAEENQRIASGQQAAPAASGAKGDDATQIVELTWRGQCMPCHGAIGHGDGPNGPMVKAPDLTREDWQANVNDEQIAQIILQGKGKMPRFDLSPTVVSGIVRRIRASRGH